MALQIRRGTDAEWEAGKQNIVAGEPAIALDSKRVFVGTANGEYTELANKDIVDPIIDRMGLGLITDYTIGEYVTVESGVWVTHTNPSFKWAVVPCEGGDYFTINTGNWVAFYDAFFTDSSGNYIQMTFPPGDENVVVTAPEGAAYFYINNQVDDSYNNYIGDWSETVLERLENPYIPNNSITTEKIADNAVTTNKLDDGAVSEDKIQNGAVTRDKIGGNAVGDTELDYDAVATNRIQDGAVTTPKLADSSVTTAKLNGVIDNTLAVSGKAADAKKTGDEISGLKDALNELDRIHVTASDDRYFNVLESGYFASSGDGYYSTLQNVIHFNTSDSFAYFVIELLPNTDYVIDPRARFLQTTMKGNTTVIQSIENTNYTSFNSGSAEIAYISVSKSLLPIKVSTLCYSLDGLYYNSEKYIPKQKCKSAVASSMGTTDSLYIADALTNLRKGTRTVFTCDITSFSEIEVGLSKADTLGTNRSSRVNVDGTNIVYKTSSLHDPVTVAHGLTIENNLSLIIEKFGGRTAKITLTSNGQMFSINDAVWVADKTGAPYMSSIGSTLTNCKLSWTCTDIDKDIWIFGDSYVQANDNRWAYYLEEFGYNKNVLIDGFGGESSSYATASLHNLIKMASPKMIIWCLGMNDGGDSGAPNTSWKSAVDDAIQVCANNDIEFIPATIPTVPNINNEYKNAWIRSSGYRYIDFAEAVGAQSDGTWFSGMLASDNVHPTVAGAKALFNRVLVDCPNVMIDQ